MGLRELKELANQQFVRGKFSQCAHTYRQVLRLAPGDPNMHVRHAEACRRSGERSAAIASYRAAAELLLELGCESRARGALKAAFELDPRDPLLQVDIARLRPHREAPLPPCVPEDRDALPLLPPLESGLDPVPPPPLAPRLPRAVCPEELPRKPALPPIHRALPSAPSVPPLGPPVLHPSATASAPRARAPAPSHAVAPPPPAEALIEAARDPGPRLEVRRLSPSALAFRCSPHDSWAVIRSHTPLELHLVENLEKLPPMMRDIPAGMTVASTAEAASSSMNVV